MMNMELEVDINYFKEQEKQIFHLRMSGKGLQTLQQAWELAG